MLRVGESIGRYRVLRTLGSGGMAVVFEAEDTEAGTRHALKVLLPNLALQPRVVERFRREAELQTRLAHPGIVRVTDYVESDAGAAIVMDLVDGPALDDYLDAREQGRALGWERAVELMRPVLAAVGYAHEQGVVHRDLKPANVLLARRELDTMIPLVSDFGIASVLAESGKLTATNSRLGTWGYMAPEQFRGARDVDARADVFSLGIMLWELVLGRLPVDLDDQVALWRLYAGDVPIARLDAEVECPRWLADVVAQALSFDRDLRFQSASVLDAAVGKNLEGGLAIGLLAQVSQPTSTVPASVSDGSVDPLSSAVEPNRLGQGPLLPVRADTDQADAAVNRTSAADLLDAWAHPTGSVESAGHTDAISWGHRRWGAARSAALSLTAAALAGGLLAFTVGRSSVSDEPVAVRTAAGSASPETKSRPAPDARVHEASDGGALADRGSVENGDDAQAPAVSESGRRAARVSDRRPGRRRSTQPPPDRRDVALPSESRPADADGASEGRASAESEVDSPPNERHTPSAVGASAVAPSVPDEPAVAEYVAPPSAAPRPPPAPSTGDRINAYLATMREQERQQQLADREKVEGDAASWQQRKQRAAALARTAESTFDVNQRLELLRRATELDPWYRSKYEAALRDSRTASPGATADGR